MLSIQQPFTGSPAFVAWPQDSNFAQLFGHFRHVGSIPTGFPFRKRSFCAHSLKTRLKNTPHGRTTIESHAVCMVLELKGPSLIIVCFCQCTVDERGSKTSSRQLVLLKKSWLRCLVRLDDSSTLVRLMMSNGHARVIFDQRGFLAQIILRG